MKKNIYIESALSGPNLYLQVMKKYAKPDTTISYEIAEKLITV